MNNFSGQFILVLWVVFLVFIFVSSFFVKREAETEGKWTLYGFLFIVCILMFLFLKYITHVTSLEIGLMIWPRTLFSDAVADIFALLGLIIAIWGRIILGHNWSMNPSLKENHELIKSGPYAYVRHPMYSGLLLMFLGTVVWYSNSGGIFIFVLCFCGTWFKLRQEEHLLTKHFGQSYLGYKLRVKALIPFIL